MTREFMGERAKPDIYREITIEIPGRPPSLNERRHWRAIARDNATWKAAAVEAAGIAVGQWQRDHGLDWRTLSKVALSVTFIVPTRIRHDVDNLISTLKPLLDGVVAANVIEDDSFEVIRYFDVGCDYRKGRRATILSISDIADEVEL